MLNLFDEFFSLFFVLFNVLGYELLIQSGQIFLFAFSSAPDDYFLVYRFEGPSIEEPLVTSTTLNHPKRESEY